MKEDDVASPTRARPWSTPLWGLLRMSDEAMMQRAIELAERGRGMTHPNPLVGAVVVAHGEVVGEGYHEGPGRAHAEVVALESAGGSAAGATLYCTLEPCTHQGRTPPCCDAIITAGVARVVIALRDPNPLVDGHGVERLRGAGIEVDLLEGDLAAQAAQQSAAYLKFVRTGLPLVTYKAAISADGKVAAAGGDARWISCEQSRRTVHTLRAAADAVLIGAGTARRDDPLLTVRDVAGRDPVRVVVSDSGVLADDDQLLRTAREVRTIVVGQVTDSAARARLASAGVELLETHALRDGLEQLAGLGLLDILCEGGPTLAGALLEQGLLDRVALFVAPLVIGRGAPDLFSTPAVSTVAEAWRLEDAEWSASGTDMLLRASVGRA
jgi:diaminohydroxyphosphoribosylaminopyrimidine deaminase/5-amino-6-(5-phosphoribosylamino)uracil reductase